ncbi:MAG TPA: FkbM family methyltransferase [Dissulfurispiraceae bacterium]|nr:FkbM family methyltransferase [Dissulfurispiraceae bacterium]
MDDIVRIIDVGARGGIDSRWMPFFHNLEVIAFEPDPEECRALNSKTFPYSVTFLPVALGAHDEEEATLFICKSAGCSSLLRPNIGLCSAYPYGKEMEVINQIPMTLTRMDTVCTDFQPDVIKVDTQGTELDILHGAGHLLDNALAVELEVEFVPQYEGQALFSDIDSYMRQQGFLLRGIRRTYWRNKTQYAHPYGGQILHGDALYLRLNRINCPKGHIILSAYRQFDLLAHFGASKLIPRQSIIIRVLSQLLSHYSNREMRRFVDRLRPKEATDWHDPDFF